MKNIIKALGIMGTGVIIFATGYFVELYVDFTQLIISLGIAGFLILAAFLYIYNWMKNKDEESSDRDKAIDMTRDYMREIEKELKKDSKP